MNLASFLLGGIVVTGWPQSTQVPLAGTIQVLADQETHAIPADFYGLMTEEINHSYDGGLYAELIRNRSFRDSTSEAAAWKINGATATLEAGETPDLRIDTGAAAVTVANSGFWGVPAKPKTTYRVTVRAKVDAGWSHPVFVRLRSSNGNLLASSQLPKLSTDWSITRLKLNTGRISPTKDARFSIETFGPGTLWLNYVSLFPPTYHGRENGNRPDLMELLSKLHPRFLRLPGGNYLEGNRVATRFEWKDTIGPVIDRKGHEGPWGYRSSDGMGLLEFLNWCEDLKMKPLLAVYAGYSLQQDHVEPGPALEPFVRDALDEIEYVTGSTATRWGAQRAKDGHPKPFPLTDVEIGNEDQFDRSQTYDGRFLQFYDAIRSRYPSLRIIATCPVQSRKPDLVDDHYYRSAAEMERDSVHYDASPRADSKIFVGEWASTEGNPTPTMQAAMGDAAWLTGLERDSDLVQMECYAPLLVNVNPGASQWGTNLIGYDSQSSFGSPSYYVQSMFALFTGSRELLTRVDVPLSAPPPSPARGAVGLGTWNTDSEYKDLTVTHDGVTDTLTDASNPAQGWKFVKGSWASDPGEGALRQSALDPGTLAVKGDSNWTDITYRLKAKKLSGEEGFLIPFHVIDDQNYWFWNVGGWGNRRTALQATENGATREAGRATRMRLDVGRWYDLRIELSGRHIRCYLDGKLVTEADEKPQPPVAPIYAAASRNSKGMLFLKIVNVSDQDADLNLAISGPAGQPSSLIGQELVAARAAVNSIANPELVAPHPIKLLRSASGVRHLFPARSVTVLRG